MPIARDSIGEMMLEHFHGYSFAFLPTLVEIFGEPSVSQIEPGAVFRRQRLHRRSSRGSFTHSRIVPGYEVSSILIFVSKL